MNADDDRRPEIRFRDATGRLRKAPLTVGRTLPNRGVLETREVTVGRTPLIQRRVPEDLGMFEPDAYTRLDNETRALCRLGQLFPDLPARLPRIRGYNVDAAEPYLLVEPWRGSPATECVRSFDPIEKVDFQRGLLYAVWYIERAGLEHHAITMDNLNWDGVDIQIVSFEKAVIASERRTGADVQGAAAVIRQMLLGPNTPRDGSRDTEVVARLLNGVSHPDPAHRPGVETLLQRLEAPREALRQIDPTDAFAEGRYEFDRAGASKRGLPEPPRPGAGSTGRNAGSGASGPSPSSQPQPPPQRDGAQPSAGTSGVAVGDRPPATSHGPAPQRQYGVVVGAAVVLLAIVVVIVVVLTGVVT